MSLQIDYNSYIGTKFNKYLIEGWEKKGSRVYFLCKCDCGLFSMVQASQLLTGVQKGNCYSCAALKHGQSRSKNKKQTRTYQTWLGLRNRCLNVKNKDYIHYGARGIKVCERWSSFENFLQDMGEKPKGLTLDRIDNNGSYDPANCRWATYSQQNSNQRRRTSEEKLQKENKKC